MKKRFFSVLLTICMLLCLVPVVHVSASNYVLDKNMFRIVIQSEIAGRVTKLKMSRKIPAEEIARSFYLNASGFVKGYVATEKDKSGADVKTFYIAPSESGNTVCLPEDSSGFFKELDLAEIDLRGLNTSNVTNMSFMFFECSSLEKLDLGSFDTSSVKNMKYMFCGCENLEYLHLSSFNTANVTDMSFMFRECKSLTSLDVSSFNTANVTTMESMFHMCKNLVSLDLSDFDTANVRNMSYMLDCCSKLSFLTFGEGFFLYDIYDCCLFNFKISDASVLHVYAPPRTYGILKDLLVGVDKDPNKHAAESLVFYLCPSCRQSPLDKKRFRR